MCAGPVRFFDGPASRSVSTLMKEAMKSEKISCEHCQRPIAADSRFCEWCGQPVMRQPAAPPRPSPDASRPAAAPTAGGRPTVLIALLAGGSLLACLLVAGAGFLWWRGQAEEPPTSTLVSTAEVVPAATDVPAATVTSQPKDPATPKSVESPVPVTSPASVVDDFIKATLGSVPGAVIDYERARSLMTAAYAAQFDSPSFVPLTYGIQDGPEGVEIVSENVSGATATVVAQGTWGGEPGTPWAFTLQQKAGAWRIAAIDAQPVSGVDDASGAVPAAVEALLGEWEVVEGEGSDAGERFRILWEPEQGLRVRWLDEFSDIEGIEDLERFYLELENEGGGRWTGVAVSVYWDPETDQATEEGREPVVLILSDGDQQLLIGPPESEGFIARRVDGS